MTLNLSSDELLERKREQSRIRNKRYREAHPEKMKEISAARAVDQKAYKKEWYLKNQEKVLEKRRAYYTENKSSLIAYQSKYQKENRKAVTKRSREWHQKRMAEDPEYQKHRSSLTCTWYKNKRRDNPAFRAVTNMRRRLSHVMNRCGVSKKASTMKLLGCAQDELKAYIESLFASWMTWENYGMGEGKWVVDHIRPLASFDMSDPAQQKLAFHYLNLQPLCWRKNMEKSDSFSG